MLKKGCKVGEYVIAFPIKENTHTQSYRVKDSGGRLFFLKLLNLAGVNPLQIDENFVPLVAGLAPELRHANIARFHEYFEWICDGIRYGALVYDFISGETLAQRLAREGKLPVYEARRIILDVLEGLKYLHARQDPILHNDITPGNIMLDLSYNPPPARIIDFDHAVPMSRYKRLPLTDEMNVHYMASEMLSGICSVQTDVFAVGALYYCLLFGQPPYMDRISAFNRKEMRETVSNARRNGLRFPENDDPDMCDRIRRILKKALADNPTERYKSAEEMYAALRDEMDGKPEVQIEQKKIVTAGSGIFVAQDVAENGKKRAGGGFADVAGMHELKAQLQSDVIELLRSREEAEQLGLSLPNGLLFYGPPGCGKTFFVEKFAEEIGCHYIYVKCSDVASPYIHGGQQKIAAIFDEARRNAPAIIFFDEIEVMVANRSMHTNISEQGEVNEFLTQLNNCGQDGIIAVGATNKPDKIDEAALRSGRFDYKYYIPLPDHETRKEIFMIHLKKRRISLGIDYDLLAERTERFVSSDIKLVVDKAARLTFRQKLPSITMENLLKAIESTDPSVTREILAEQDANRDKFEGRKIHTKRSIGF